VLSDRNQNWFIHEWLRDNLDSREWSVLHARLRDEPAEERKKKTAREAVGA
jgi:hypothetical protein